MAPRGSVELYNYEERLAKKLRDVRPLLGEFVAYLRVEGLSVPRQIKHLENVVKFEERFLRGRLEEAGLSAFRKGFDRLIMSELDNDTKAVYKTSLRKFYRFLLETRSRSRRRKSWKEILRFVESVRIKETEPKIEPITEEEFARMYEAADNDQLRAMLSIMYEAGPRSGELLTCRIKDVVVFDDYAEVHVTGKTGQGTLILVRSRADLVKHLQSHPLRNDPDAPLWYMWTRRGLRALSYDAFRMRIKRLAEKAGIKRRIYPHLFRHAAATEKASFLTDREMCIVFRWSKNSTMPARYAHLAVRGVKEKILSQYFENYVPRQNHRKTCWRCGAVLHNGVKYCPQCGATVSDSELYMEILRRKEIEEKRKEADKIMDILLRDPRVRRVVEEVLAEIYAHEKSPAPQPPSSPAKPSPNTATPHLRVPHRS